MSEALQAEIDHLRAEVAKLPELTLHRLRPMLADVAGEIDRLRAENTKLVQCGEDYIREAQCLRAKNAELRQLLTEYGSHSDGCSAKFGKEYRCRCGWNGARELLAKTAKEGE